jgi:hypothetical protein
MTKVMNGAIPPATTEDIKAGNRSKKNCRLDTREKRSRTDGAGPLLVVSAGCCGGTTSAERVEEMGEIASDDFLKSTGEKKTGE